MTPRRTLFIVDSVAASRALLAEQGADVREEVLSTRPSVVDFLATRGVLARDCSEFINAEQASAAIRKASADLDAQLARLDETVGARMCAAAGLPHIALFHPCFKYLGQYNLAGLETFERVLGERLARGDLDGVRFYHALETSDNPLFSFVSGARRVCKQHRVACAELQVHRTASVALSERIFRVLRLGLRAPQVPGRVLGRLLRRLKRWRASQGSSTAPIALFLNPGEESFFETALSSRGMRLVYLPPDGVAPMQGVAMEPARRAVERMRQAAAEWLSAQPVREGGDLDWLFVSYIVGNAVSMLLPMSYAHLCLQSQPITVAAWDLPLVTRPHLNLVAELLLKRGVPVLGRQHGANYVDQDLGSIHFDSDFDRCTHYFSYGFGPEEFAATYPARRTRCAFVPAGNPPVAAGQWTSMVDVVFPLTFGGSLFYLARMPESELARRQAHILEAMESRRDLHCIVKPPPNLDDDEYAHVEALRKLRHVRIATAPWTDYLRCYRPRLIVMETASTPLFEALSLDVDIFLMLDPVFPFTDTALAMLRKRVHVFATERELAQAICRYGIDPLLRLRDQTYYRTYVNRGSAEAVFGLLETPALTRDCKAVP